MNRDQNDETTTEADIYPLDDAAIATIAELDAQERQYTLTALAAALDKIQTSRNAVLSYFLRQHNLIGNWTLSTNRRELTRSRQAQP